MHFIFRIISNKETIYRHWLSILFQNMLSGMSNKIRKDWN